MSASSSSENSAQNGEDPKPAATVPGTVEKVIKPFFPGQPEKVQIAIETADHLYKEIRVENTLVTPEGETVGLKEGAQVEVTIAADVKDTVKKDEEEARG